MMDNFFYIIIIILRIVQYIGILLIFLTLPIFIIHYSHPVLASITELDEVPEVNDPNLMLELVSQQEIKPSSMAFLGSGDILILNKNDGTVHRIINGALLEEPLLDVNVANAHERGMLGIATTASNNGNGTKYVFLYYTESSGEDGNDICTTPDHCEPGNDPLGNRLYRYELKDNKLLYPKLLLDLPATPGPTHNGGAIQIGPDNNLYVPIGDVHGQSSDQTITKAQNFENGTDPDGRSGILVVTQDGKPVNGSKAILGDKYPLNLYYAYGIRNSFGIDFDPVTGNLWDTENGPSHGDEINLVEPGFNSGWMQVQGDWTLVFPPGAEDFIPGKEILNLDTLESSDFGGKGRYSPPQFIWKIPVGVTAVKFLDSNKLGEEYENDMFVGDFNNGRLYHFELNEDRTGLSFQDGPLKDGIVDEKEESEEAIIAEGFGSITDIEVGPDGLLYVLSQSEDEANIFKIMHRNSE
jgi:glucose/arabinose dehydrogenase